MRMLALTLLAFALPGIAAAAADPASLSNVSQTNVGPAPSYSDTHPYSQMFSVLAGPFQPKSLQTSNSSSSFQYTGMSLKSYVVEPGWSIKLFNLLGALSFEESLPLSMFKATLPGSSDGLSLYMVGADTRLRHSWEWFPVRAIVPFVEGGYRLTFFSQSGPSDSETAQGMVGNVVAGAGVDLWVNSFFSGSDSVTKYNAIPFFLTAKMNYIAPSDSSGVSLGGTSFLVGLSVGI